MKTRHFLMLALSILLLSACGGASSESEPPTATTAAEMAEAVAPTETPTPEPDPPTATPTMVEQSPTDTPEPEVEPTDTPAEEAATESDPTNTPQPEPEPTDTPEPDPPTPTPEPAVQAGGTAGFRNNLGTADQFVLNLTGVPAPPEGQAYQGWLVADDGSATNVGPLTVNADGTATLQWNSPGTENLLSRYSRLEVSLEPAGGSESAIGPVVFAGGMEAEALANARRLFVKNQGEPATPLDTAFLPGLIAQTDIAVQHVQNAVNAGAIGALPETRTHLEHVVNILEGAAGPRFGDHDGNGNAENPGDGFGVVGYTEQISTLLSGQPAVVEAATAVKNQVSALQDKSLEILQLEDMAAANAQLAELKTMADQLRAGEVAALYQAAQQGVSFEVTSLE